MLFMWLFMTKPFDDWSATRSELAERDVGGFVFVGCIK